MQRFGGVFDVQAGEVSELDDARLPVVELGEPFECVIQDEHIHRLALAAPTDCHVGIVEREWSHAIATLPCPSAACVIDENAAHELRRDAEEVRTVPPFDAALVDEAEIRLVHQRRRLKGDLIRLAPHRTGCLTMQLGIDGREELLANLLLARPPTNEEASDVGRGWYRRV